MTWIMVDIEADGPIPGDYSMVCIDAIVVEPALDRTFYAQLRPISEHWVPQSLAVSGFERTQCMDFPDPHAGIAAFAAWAVKVGGKRPMFVSDNNGFDWQFVNWYLHHFLGTNPFGFSSTNLGSLYKGLAKNAFVNFKHLRKTAHTHHPVDDARGNAEAMLAMASEHALKIRWDE